MCRALLYLGEPVLLDNLLYQPDSALVRQSTMPKMLHMLNLAGFGMRAWDRGSRAPEKPWAYASTELPVFDRNLKNLAEKVEAGRGPGPRARAWPTARPWTSRSPTCTRSSFPARRSPWRTTATSRASRS